MKSNKRNGLVFGVLIGLLSIDASYSANGSASFVYDNLGRLSRVTYNNGKEISYTYDASGNRVEQIVTVNVTDSDGDGIDDNADNCLLIANATQTDTDGDLIGNACDPDFNQNGIVDQFDFSRLKACFGQTTCVDEDLNGNGIVDQFDFSRLKSMFGKAPGPSALVP